MTIQEEIDAEVKILKTIAKMGNVDRDYRYQSLVIAAEGLKPQIHALFDEFSDCKNFLRCVEWKEFPKEISNAETYIEWAYRSYVDFIENRKLINEDIETTMVVSSFLPRQMDSFLENMLSFSKLIKEYHRAQQLGNGLLVRLIRWYTRRAINKLLVKIQLKGEL